MEAVSAPRHLATLFEPHQIECVVHGEWVASTGRLPVIRATWYVGEKTGRLDVDVLLEDEHQLQEAFTGIGSSEGDLQDTLRSSASNSFHMLLPTFWSQAGEDQVMVETWETGEWCFEVCTGNPGLRGVEGRAPLLPTGLFSSIERTIRAEPLDARLHWFRYLFCASGSQRTAEALFDNQLWKAGIQNLAVLSWQDSQGYYSIHNSLMLKPLTQVAAPRSLQGADGGFIPVRSPFDKFDPYHTTGTAAILWSLADGMMQISSFIGRRHHDSQTRRTRD